MLMWGASYVYKAGAMWPYDQVTYPFGLQELPISVHTGR